MTTNDLDVPDEDAGIPAELLAERDELARRLAGVRAKIAAARLAQLTAEPLCPECDAGVLRPKCFFELGLGCPRHDVVDRYGGATALARHLRAQTSSSASSPASSPAQVATTKGED